MFNRRKNILVLGSDGMLGYDVINLLIAESVKKDSNIGIVHGIQRGDKISFSNESGFNHYLDNSVHYDYCINCIAYTNTSNCDPKNKIGFNTSYRLNAVAPLTIAKCCKKHKIHLIHISTDYVFSEHTTGVWDECMLINSNTDDDEIDTNIDEHKNDYLSHVSFGISDIPSPINVYGMHKLIGEENIAKVYNHDTLKYSIIRTSWLYGNHKHKSFIHRFLKNAVYTVTKTNEVVTMTTDEFSIPTSTLFLTNVIKQIINNDIIGCGIVHACPKTEHGAGISRFDFAQYILDCIRRWTQIYEPTYNEVINKINLYPKVRYSAGRIQPMVSTLRPTVNLDGYWNTWLEKFMDSNIYDIINFVF
jgi:dTDP-4-dehydrorhamnose reductase